MILPMLKLNEEMELPIAIGFVFAKASEGRFRGCVQHVAHKNSTEES